MVMRAPTRSRSQSLIRVAPVLAVEEQIQGLVPPDQQALAALAEAAVEPPAGDPLVDGLWADPCQGGELLDRQDGGVTVGPVPLEGPAKLVLRQQPLTPAHGNPSYRRGHPA